jgi:hypothetical protein
MDRAGYSFRDMPKPPRTRVLHRTLVALGVLLTACDQPAPPPPAPESVEAAARERRRPLREYAYEPVATNPDVAAPDGFRGDVHPLLHGAEALEVTARWSPTLSTKKRGGIKLGVIDNASSSEYSIPPALVALLTESKPALPVARHGARALSAFLPQEIEAPGQMWRIEPEAAAAFLRQFHPGASMAFERYHQPYGRRPGPPGAFGILRAASPEHLDVVFRVHAEFVLADGAALYTPACFLGRMLVDRRAGTVESFEMRVPADLGINLNITLTFRLPDDRKKEVTNIVFERVEPMELRGGDPERLAELAWDSEIDLAEAHARLKSAFYKFMDVDWVPLEDAVEVARREQKPIVCIVLTSPLEDQSC